MGPSCENAGTPPAQGSGTHPGPDLGIGKGGNCPPKCPDCPTKHDSMQNTHIQKSALGLELEFSMYCPFLNLTYKNSTKKSTRMLQKIN